MRRRRGPMDQEGTAESRRGTRTRVAQGTEGPVKQWWRRGPRTRVVQRGEGKRSSGGAGASKAVADGGDRVAAVWGRMPPAAMWPR